MMFTLNTTRHFMHIFRGVQRANSLTHPFISSFTVSPSAPAAVCMQRLQTSHWTQARLPFTSMILSVCPVTGSHIFFPGWWRHDSSHSVLIGLPWSNHSEQTVLTSGLNFMVGKPFIHSQNAAKRIRCSINYYYYVQHVVQDGTVC